jgi:hypothetical protein
VYDEDDNQIRNSVFREAWLDLFLNCGEFARDVVEGGLHNYMPDESLWNDELIGQYLEDEIERSSLAWDEEQLRNEMKRQKDKPRSLYSISDFVALDSDAGGDKEVSPRRKRKTRTFEEADEVEEPARKRRAKSVPF